MQFICFYYENKLIGVESGRTIYSDTYGKSNTAVGINLDEQIYGGII